MLVEPADFIFMLPTFHSEFNQKILNSGTRHPVYMRMMEYIGETRSR